MKFDPVTPIYVQIADDLRAQILTGALDEGDQVMSTTTYATTYRINPATAAKAFAQLNDEELLEKRRGVGMFVRVGARERLRARRRLSYVTQTLAPAVKEGLALGLDVDDIVSQVHAIARTPNDTQEK